MATQESRIEAETKRRKVRKGTHSCWECRRRKIKCQFDSSSDTTCIQCQSRGSHCQSQELVDESLTVPPPDRRLAQRLARLEELMEKLMDRLTPETSTSDSSTTRTRSLSPVSSLHGSLGQTVDILDNAFTEDNPVGLLLGLHGGDQVTPSLLKPPNPTSEQTSHDVPPKGSSNRYEKVCKSLLGLFPSQHDLDLIVNGTAATFFVTSMFYCREDVVAGDYEPPSALGIIPPVTSHPTVLAKRLLQLCVCIQQLSPAFDKGTLTMKSALSETMNSIISTVASLVTSNDELIGTLEGLQCLVLHAMWNANAGNLRKAWLINRRALSLCQLMGLGQRNLQPLKSADPTLDQKKWPSLAGMWFRAVYNDRFMSILLGLPLGTVDNSFATEEAMVRDSPVERLGKAHAVVCAQIIERNSNKISELYGKTQEIDLDLEKASQLMPRSWWEAPTFDPFASREELVEATYAFVVQMHHFDLLTLLHLPYMLRDVPEERYEYSRITCMRSSREVLKRFVTFRTLISSAFTCRHVDYSALIASMTLLLSHLGRKKQASSHIAPMEGYTTWALESLHTYPPNSASACQYEDDRKLVQAVQERMRHVALVNGDKLSQESGDIIGQLMSVLDTRQPTNSALSESEHGSVLFDCLQLTVPYLGTVSIHPNPPPGRPAGQVPLVELARAEKRRRTDDDAAGQELSVSDPGVLGQVPNVDDPQGGQTDFSLLDPNFAGANESSLGMSFMQFESQIDSLLPELTAEGDDWAFQGVDTAYWSLLNIGI